MALSICRTLIKAAEINTEVDFNQPHKKECVEFKPIQIKIPTQKHTEIKAFAARSGMSITDLLLLGYEQLRKTNEGS